MKCSVVLALVFAIGTQAAFLELNANRPVNKVIALLKDMQAQLEKEQAEDEAVYEKLACWCEVNDKAKTKAIEEAEERITQLGSSQEGLGATQDRLKKEIAALEKEIEKNDNALAQATSIREKEHNEFAAENGDLGESIASLKAAIAVLSKHHRPQEALLHISTVIKHALHKHADILTNVLSHHDHHAVKVFLQGDFFGEQSATFKQAYAPQSGEIFGILTQMLETFQANMGAAEKEEADAQSQYDALKEAKEGEIDAGKEELEDKKQQLAKSGEDAAQSDQDLEDTKASLAADQQFLADLKEKCKMTDDEWEQRQKTRQEEMKAVSEALAILTSDDAHDLFVRTFNPDFAQVSVVQTRRRQAEDVIRKAAKKYGSTALLQLVSSMSLDGFEKVKAAIDDMVKQLKKEQADEQKHRDWCNQERNENDGQTEAKDRTKTELKSLIEELTQSIDSFAKEIETLHQEITDSQIEIKRAGEDREAENKEFQQTVTDQRATQAVLAKALQVLQNFYNKAGLLQTGQAPPEGFKEYAKNTGGAQGVMSLLESIISDAKRMESEAVEGEKDSQGAYETFVKDTNAAISAKQEDITNKSEDKAKAETDQVQAKEDLEGTLTDLEELAQFSSELHASCDFIVNNFDVRQTARGQEIEALVQAKAILSGASFSGASLLRRA